MLFGGGQSLHTRYDSPRKFIKNRSRTCISYCLEFYPIRQFWDVFFLIPVFELLKYGIYDTIKFDWKSFWNLYVDPRLGGFFRPKFSAKSNSGSPKNETLSAISTDNPRMQSNLGWLQGNIIASTSISHASFMQINTPGKGVSVVSCGGEAYWT